VAVDEARPSLLGDGRSIKNLDFIVSAPDSAAWLVDVKGRRFPSAEDRYWKVCFDALGTCLSPLSGNLLGILPR
jgi:hypothetical protein